MDVCVAGAIATAAASAISWSMHQDDDPFSARTMARITADVVPTIAVVGQCAYMDRSLSLRSLAKRFAMSLLASMAQIFRGSHTMTSRTHPALQRHHEPLLINILPIALTIYSSKFSTEMAIYTIGYNVFLTSRDLTYMQPQAYTVGGELDRRRERRLLMNSLLDEEVRSVASHRYVSKEDADLIRAIDYIKRLHV
jgi:hypothetical protein